MASLKIKPSVMASDECLRYEFNLRYPDHRDDISIFYEVFGPHLEAPENFDCALFATIFHAMRNGLNIELEGPASIDALRNLTEFQLAWSSWLPQKYHPVEINVSHIKDSAAIAPKHTISAYSGGVDATFTMLKNAPSTEGYRHPLAACLLVQGFDIGLNDQADFERVLEAAKRTHATFGLDTYWVRTNLKSLDLNVWEDSFAAQLASCLHLLSRRFSTALIGSSEPYNALVLPWGSNPLTDHLLSGSALAVVHDGAGFSRTQKVEFLSKIPGGTDNLRVCWEGKRKDRNCGRCEKCIRTKMNLLAVGVKDPKCFDEPLDASTVGRIRVTHAAGLAELQSIIDYAEKNSVEGVWLDQLRGCVAKGVRMSWKPYAWRVLHKMGLSRNVSATLNRLRAKT